MEAAYNCRSTTITATPPPPLPPLSLHHYHHHHRHVESFPQSAVPPAPAKCCESNRVSLVKDTNETRCDTTMRDNSHVDQPPNADYTLLLRILKLPTDAQIDAREIDREIENEAIVILSSARYPITQWRRIAIIIKLYCWSLWEEWLDWIGENHKQDFIIRSSLPQDRFHLGARGAINDYASHAKDNSISEIIKEEIWGARDIYAAAGRAKLKRITVYHA